MWIWLIGALVVFFAWRILHSAQADDRERKLPPKRRKPAVGVARKR